MIIQGRCTSTRTDALPPGQMQTRKDSPYKNLILIDN